MAALGGVGLSRSPASRNASVRPLSFSLPNAQRKQDHQAIPLHASGLPVTARPLIDAGLLYDDEGASIKTSKHGGGRIASTGALSCRWSCV